jgi:hypothetical protein
LVASNLAQGEWNPAKIATVYKRRMQIEQGFRDVKSKHLGLGLNLLRSHCLHRIEILLLIAALAHCLLFLTGLLSLWRLGLESWRRCIEFGGSGDWERLEKALRDEVHHQAQSLE